jgi:hypothetical protein
MPPIRISSLASLAVLLGLAPMSAHAGPSALAPQHEIGNRAVHLAGYRHHHRHGWRHRHRHHDGRDIAIGLGLQLLGAIASEAGRTHHYYRDDPHGRCAARFRSFEWDTGLYTTYGGEKRLCPYLR